MGRMENKVAVVTGSARGIGRATCLLLAEEGAYKTEETQAFRLDNKMKNPRRNHFVGFHLGGGAYR